MGLEKLELLAQKLIRLEDDYDAYEFADTYDDYLPNLDDDKYDGIVGDTMSAIVNNSYEILNELEDMYYDVEDVDEEMANDILSLMDEVEVYSSYTPAERVNENRLLEAYLNKKEITMENKFESIINETIYKSGDRTEDELYKDNMELLEEYERRVKSLLTDISDLKELCKEDKLDQSILNNEISVGGSSYYDAPEHPLSMIDNIKMVIHTAWSKAYKS